MQHPREATIVRRQVKRGQGRAVLISAECKDQAEKCLEIQGANREVTLPRTTTKQANAQKCALGTKG